jgi:hypothetical protein
MDTHDSQQPHTARPHPVQQTSAAGRGSYAPISRQLRQLLVPIIVIVLLLIGAAVWLVMHQSAAPLGDRYQAVYVQTGQIYFGKLKNTDGRYLRLENAYVAKTQDVPANATAEQKAAVSSNVSLAKVSSQVYGPDDTLEIRADQVVFWQNLKSDSKVSQAIESKN